MRRSKIYIGMVRVINTASLSIGIVWSSQFREVTTRPRVDANDQHRQNEYEEDNQTKKIST